MTVTPQGSTPRTSRGRIAAALCTVAVVAMALSSNLIAAGGQQTVPGEPVAGAPTQVASEPDPSGEASAPATTTPATPATTTTATPSATTTAAPTTTATNPTAAPSSPAPSDRPRAPATPAAPATGNAAPAPLRATTAPAPRPAPIPTKPAASRQPADTVEPLPLAGLAGLAGPADTTDGEPGDCAPATAPRQSTAKAKRAAKAKLDPDAFTTVDDARPAAAADETCVMPDSVSATTTSPDRAEQHAAADATTLRNAEGVPTTANPTTSLALPGPVPVGVPNFFIDKFRIPPFLLPIYQAAGVEYGLRWEVLAAINEIETDYGRNLNVSSAGALGWMQFLPETWKQYGTDANGDGQKDPFNPVDAIFAAARYLRAAGADQDLRRAIFAYNHADWYVESVLMRARLIGGLPSDLVGSLSGLTQGHFPVYAKARYADDLAERAVQRRAAATTNVAQPVESEPTRRGIDIFANAGAPAIAVQDGTIIAIGVTNRLGRYVRLRDAYANTYTYA